MFIKLENDFLKIKYYILIIKFNNFSFDFYFFKINYFN